MYIYISKVETLKSIVKSPSLSLDRANEASPKFLRDS